MDVAIYMWPTVNCSLIVYYNLPNPGTNVSFGVDKILLFLISPEDFFLTSRYVSKHIFNLKSK